MKLPALLGLLALIGCASSTPRNIYVLSVPADPVAGVHAEDGRPIVELRTVELPDYLDNTDILQRGGRNELKASSTGRWGERLSVGITHALAVALTRRLPSDQVIQSSSSEQPGRMVQVDIDAVDIQPDGRCVLTARWTILQEDRRTVARTERGTFVTQSPSGGVSDASVVSAMEAAVEQLADRIAAALRRAPGRPR